MHFSDNFQNNRVLALRMCKYSYSLSPSVDVWTLAFSADSYFLATDSHNGKINLFSVKDGKKESALDTRGKFTMSIAYVHFEIHEVASFYH